jgi:hypothetical protein
MFIGVYNIIKIIFYHFGVTGFLYIEIIGAILSFYVSEELVSECEGMGRQS